MSAIWQHATKANPCPICKSPDWCCFGDRAMKCMRVESEHACPSGGWYHFYGSGEARPDFVPRAKEAPKAIDAAKMMREWRSKTTTAQFEILAQQLGVLSVSAIAIGAAWAKEFNAWAFPMRDGHGETIGIRLRNIQGFKWAVTGSRQGIFLPEPSVKLAAPVLFPEGPTDTMAGLSLGFYTIGRPTNLTGIEHIRVAVKRLGIYRVVVVADNDDLKKRNPLGDAEWRPGIEGAQKLKKDLGLPSVIWQPTGQVKDIRDFLRRGGNKTVIDAQIKDRVWSKS